MPDDDLNINIKELLLRIEASLKDEIGDLKREVEMFQEKTVTRKEYEASMSHLKKEVERIERVVETNAMVSKEELKTFRQDLKDSQNRLIAVAGLVFTAVNFIVSWLIL